jgi:hypothetical protein
VAGGQIARLSADAFTVPTGGCTGLGYSYTIRAAATVVNDILAPLLMQGDLFAIPAHHAATLGPCATSVAAASPPPPFRRPTWRSGT